MSLGTPVSKDIVDSRSASFALTLRTTFDDIEHFKIWLDTRTDQDLTGLGYTVEEVATLRSAVADMDELRRIYEGLASLAPAKDFRTFTKLLINAS